MQIVAAANAATVLERFGKVPMEFWGGLGLGVAAIVIAIGALRKLAGANKVARTAIAGFFITALGFSWINARNESTWAEPTFSRPREAILRGRNIINFPPEAEIRVGISFPRPSRFSMEAKRLSALVLSELQP